MNYKTKSLTKQDMLLMVNLIKKEIERQIEFQNQGEPLSEILLSNYNDIIEKLQFRIDKAIQKGAM